MGGVGPMFGQLGFFYAFGGKDIEDPRPRERYINEAIRLLNVIEQQLESQQWLCGDYSIADIAIAPWLQTLSKFYQAEEVTGLANFTRVNAYLERFAERPAVERGWNSPERPA